MSKTTNRFSREVRARAVRLVLDNEGQHGWRWQAVMSIAAKIGCVPQTLTNWVNKSEVYSGKRAGVSVLKWCADSTLAAYQKDLADHPWRMACLNQQ